MTRNDYRHHSAWNDRNEAKMRWMTSEWRNEKVAQTAKSSSHSTHFDVIRLIPASSKSSVQWGWLINDPKMRSSSGPKLTTFPPRKLRGRLTIGNTKWDFQLTGEAPIDCPLLWYVCSQPIIAQLAHILWLEHKYMSKRITYLFNNKNWVTENPLATSEPNNFESTKFGDYGF